MAAKKRISPSTSPSGSSSGDQRVRGQVPYYLGAWEPPFPREYAAPFTPTHCAPAREESEAVMSDYHDPNAGLNLPPGISDPGNEYEDEPGREVEAEPREKYDGRMMDSLTDIVFGVFKKSVEAQRKVGQ